VGCSKHRKIHGPAGADIGWTLCDDVEGLLPKRHDETAESARCDPADSQLLKLMNLDGELALAQDKDIFLLRSQDGESRMGRSALDWMRLALRRSV
jgi:hypothetical protein